MDELLGSATELSTALVSVFVGFALVLDSVPILGVLIPADVAVLAATTARSPLASVAVVAAVVAGTLAGWTLSFTVGRYLAGPLRRSWLGRRIGQDRWDKAEKLVAKGGGRVVLAAPFLPIFNTIVPIAAGSLRMPYGRFLVYAAVGSAMWGGGYVTLGLVANSLGSAVFGTSNIYTTLLFGIPGLAIGWVTLAQVKRRMATGSSAGSPGSAGSGRVVARVAAAATSQPSDAARAARSSVPASSPRPTMSIARPAAASRGTARPAAKRLAVRRRRTTGVSTLASGTAGDTAGRTAGGSGTTAPGVTAETAPAADASGTVPAGVAEPVPGSGGTGTVLGGVSTEAVPAGGVSTTDGSASTIMATAASAKPPMLATACAMSWWLALSYGGNGQPAVQGTAPEAAAKGAEPASARIAIIPASRSRSRRRPVRVSRRAHA